MDLQEAEEGPEEQLELGILQAEEAGREAQQKV